MNSLQIERYSQKRVAKTKQRCEKNDKPHFQGSSPKVDFLPIEICQFVTHGVPNVVLLIRM